MRWQIANNLWLYLYILNSTMGVCLNCHLGAFFVGQRGTTCGAMRGLYGCPGGKVEEIDYNYCGNFLCGLFRAASRELDEETGLHVEYTNLSLMWTDVGIPGYAVHYFATCLVNPELRNQEENTGAMIGPWVLLSSLPPAVRKYGVVPAIKSVEARMNVMHRAKVGELFWSDAQEAAVIAWVFFRTPSDRGNFNLISQWALDYLLLGYHKKNLNITDWEKIFVSICEKHHQLVGRNEDIPLKEDAVLSWIQTRTEYTEEEGKEMLPTNDLIIDGTVEFIWAENF